MRTPLVIGNWKLNGSKALVTELIPDIISTLQSVTNAQVVVCPPVIFLDQVSKLTKGTVLTYGAQNIDIHQDGAFTGEISAQMLKDFNCSLTLIGHSERRALHSETDEIVAKKFAAALAVNLTPVLCIGETIEQNTAGQTYMVLKWQLQAVINHCGITNLAKAAIAYEPIWAIGTGKSASAEQAQAVHAYIRQYLAIQDQLIADKMQIIYGGSVKAVNAKTLFAMQDIDGFLVGGASLAVEEFKKIMLAVK